MNDATDARLLDLYLATRWTVTTPHGAVDLRIGAPADPRIPVPSAIITAYNPGVDDAGGDGDATAGLRPHEWNAAAQARLRRELSERAFPLFDTLSHGIGPDAGRWDESGVLASGIALADAVSIGDAFGQNAIVWIAPDGVPRIVVTRAGFAGAGRGTIIEPDGP